MADEPDFEVEMLLKRKVRNGQVMYWVKWKGFPDSDNTWEPEQDLTCTDLIREFKERSGPPVLMPIKKQDPDPTPPKKMIKLEGGKLVLKQEKGEPLVDSKDIKPIIKKEIVKKEVVKKEEPVDQKPFIEPPPKRKLQTGKRSVPPRNPPISGRVPLRDGNGPVKMKELDETASCKRPYGFELGATPDGVIGYKLSDGKLYYLLKYKDHEEWTPSEWAEMSEWGLARILIPYYTKVLETISKAAD